MIIAIGVIAWILIGALLGLYEARRGHWRWLWFMGAIAGPFSIPLFRQIEQNEILSQAYPLTTEPPSDGDGLRVLVGVDGSPASKQSALRAIETLGQSLADVTFATVTDYEISESIPGPLVPEDIWDPDEKVMMLDLVDEAAERFDIAPSAVLLVGEPADALQRHAVEEDFDLVVVGTRGRGLTNRLLGSCATRLAASATSPVLLMPAEADDDQSGGRRSAQGRAVSS